MTTILTPDICIIGAGSGGLTAAAAAASFGVPVVLVEKGRMGGDCLNFGCVPSKALLAAAKHAQAVRDGGRFGIGAAEPEIDFRNVQRHIRSVIDAIAPNDSEERFTALGVQVIKAEARFADRRTVIAGDFRIRARRFIVATGSSPCVPDIPGLREAGFLTNENVFDLVRRPAHLLIVGGGPIGLELAQAYRRLGSRVTVIAAAHALAGEDRELARIAIARIRAEGVDLRENCRVVQVEARGRFGVSVQVKDDDGERRINASRILVAAGRAPAVSGIGLEKARIAYGPTGIRVDDRLRTTNRRVYAIGDAAGGPQFTHLAGHHAGLVVRSILFRMRARQDPAIIPRVTFTDPELAQVGLTEDEARKERRDIRVLRWPFAENDRAQAERQTSGLVKIIADRRGRILGAGIVGAQAGELIGIWALAIARSMRVRDMTGYIPPYPTMGEIGKRAAIDYYSSYARKPAVRRLIGLLRKFG